MDHTTTTTGHVQQCGCIALPEEVQLQTGLYAGATYEIEVTERGAVVLLRPLETREPGEFGPGARCG
jgi:hypothetical protein